MSNICDECLLSLKWLPKKPAGKPETPVFLLEKPETAGFPKSQDCPQPTAHPINGPKQLLMGYLVMEWSNKVPEEGNSAPLSHKNWCNAPYICTRL